MQLSLTKDLFKDGQYQIVFGQKEALFTIVNEEFSGLNTLGKINRIVILVRSQGGGDERLCTGVIGMGDGVIGVKSSDPLLKGQFLTQDNMSQCTIELFD